jgi:hypothetical protein
MNASRIAVNAAHIAALVVLAALAVQGHASALLVADDLTAEIVRASELDEMEEMSVAQASSEAASGSTSSKEEDGDSNLEDDGDSNLGTIIGAVAFGVAELALIAGLIVLVITRRKKSQNVSPPHFIPPAPPAPTASLAAQYQTDDTDLSNPSNAASDTYAVSGVSSAPSSPAAPMASPQTSAPPMATPWVPSNPDPSWTGQQLAVHSHGNNSSSFTSGPSQQQQPDVYPDAQNAPSLVDQQQDQQQTVPFSPYDYGMLSQAPFVPPYDQIR